ncbi:MAG: pyruvate carboxylase subunit B, partial [Acidimicrobiales bacterium]
PAAFASWLREQSVPQVTDTTLRDAHQSILATRVRTIDLVAGARHIAHSNPTLLSLEAWGGATFDVAVRFLKENPWQRLERIREAAPNICLQMLLRGRNTVGYSPYPDSVSRSFVIEAQRTGIDIFRIFDAFNNIEQMKPAIDAVLETGAIAQGTVCYTSNLSNPDERLYTLDYYLERAAELVEAGVHILAVKDMAGLLRAPAARKLIPALREAFDLPVVLHSHDTAGGQVASYLAAIEAGVDAVDAAAAPLSGMTSQPSIAAVVAATNHTQYETGITIDSLGQMEPYWEAVRHMYRPFEAGLDAPTGTVYRHEIPGGQLSNLRQQAIALGLGDRFDEIEVQYEAVNKLLGNVIKVTPSSKVVGDLALHLVASGVSVKQLEDDPASVDLPDSVIGFLHGDLGDPPGGWPEPFRTNALVGRRPKSEPVALSRADAEALDDERAQETLTRLLFAAPHRDFVAHEELYGDVSVLPTRLFLYGLNVSESDIPIGLDRGVRLLVGLDAIGEPDRRGMRQVVFRLNGQIRSLEIRDRSADNEVGEAERADPDNGAHVAAPFHGVVTTKVEVGDHLESGDPVAIIEAMKMESVIRSPHAGTVSRVALSGAAAVESGDLVLVLDPD